MLSIANLSCSILALYTGNITEIFQIGILTHIKIPHHNLNLINILYFIDQIIYSIMF